MALNEVQDPNIGRTQRPVTQKNVRTFQGADSAGVAVDPMTKRIFDNSTEIAQGELVKSIQKDYLRGQLMAAQGKSIQDVRKDAPWLERAYGQGATIEGASQQILRAAQSDYQLGVLNNIDELKKLTPEEFRERQIADFEGFLTGDEEVDSRLTTLSTKMFANAAESVMPQRLKYVQEEAMNSWTSQATSAAALVEGRIKAGFINPEQEQAAYAEFAEAIEKPDEMYDENYVDGLGNLAIARLDSGDRFMYDSVKESLPFTRTQQEAMQKAEQGWRRAKQDNMSSEIGTMISHLITSGDTGTKTEDMMLDLIKKGEEFIGYGFKLTPAQHTSILQNAIKSSDAGVADQVKRASVDAYWSGTAGYGQNESFYSDNGKVFVEKYYDPASVATQKQEDVVKGRGKLMSNLTRYATPVKMISRITDAALNSPILDGQTNPALDKAYDIYRDVVLANGIDGFTAVQYTAEQQAKFSLYESLVGSGDEKQAVAKMQFIKENPLPPEFFKTAEYLDSKEDGVTTATGNDWGWSDVEEMEEGGVHSEWMKAEYNKLYDSMFMVSQDHTEAREATLKSLKQNFYVDEDGGFHRQPQGKMMSQANLPLDADYGGAMKAYINSQQFGRKVLVAPEFIDAPVEAPDSGLSVGSSALTMKEKIDAQGLEMQKGRLDLNGAPVAVKVAAPEPVYEDTTTRWVQHTDGSTTFIVQGNDGEQQFIRRPSKVVGDLYRTNMGLLADERAEISKQVANDNLKASAREWYLQQGSVPFAGDPDSQAKRDELEQSMPSDNELVEMYSEAYRKGNALGLFEKAFLEIGDMFSGGAITPHFLRERNKSMLKNIKAAAEYRANPNSN